MGKNISLSLEEQQQVLSDLETRLQAAIRPVSPRPEFVGELHNRLVRQPALGGAVSENDSLKFYLIAGASLLSGTFVLVLFVRGLIALLGGLGLLRREPGGIETDTIAPLQPAV